MGSKVCEPCGISYPVGRAAPCAVCGGDLKRTWGNPDADWRKKVEELLATRYLEEEELDAEHVSIFGWRLGELLDAGYTMDHAGKLAGDPLVDLHRACDLIRRGCAEPLAFDILS